MPQYRDPDQLKIAILREFASVWKFPLGETAQGAGSRSINYVKRIHSS
jgi:hypothetical protein